MKHESRMDNLAVISEPVTVVERFRMVEDDTLKKPSAGFLDVVDLAKHLKMPRTWIYDHTGPSCSDPIPHYKFGKYLRFDIGTEEFKTWLKRNFRS
jgi:hypothetical protein